MIAGGCFGAFAEQNNADTEEEAIRIALEYVGLSEDQVQFTTIREDMNNDSLFWEIEFNSDGVEYHYNVEARTGRIMEYCKEPVPVQNDSDAQGA